MMGCLPVDAAGDPLRPAIIWADQRGLGGAALLAERVGEERVYRITGHRVSSSYSLAKLLWIREHEPDVFRRTHRVLHAKDFLRLRLTGRAETDYSDASGMNLLDLSTRSWSAEILDAIGLGPERLPDVRPSTHVAGELGAAMAAELGLARGTPIVVGGGDGPCAAVGAGVVDEGLAYAYVGSSAWIALATRQPIFDPERRTFNFWHLDPDRVTPTGTMQSAGASYQWARNVLGQAEMAEAARQGGSAYELMDRLAAQSPPGGRGLLFLPYLMGERSPHWNPAARGVFIGLTLSHTRADMLRAVLEGVAFNLRIILDAFRRQGVAIDALRVIGGGAKGALWRQVLADVLGTPVERLALLEEATSLGAAVAGAVAVGLLPGFAAARDIVRVRDVHRPDPRAGEVYERQYAIFKDAYEALVPVYARLHALTAAESARGA